MLVVVELSRDQSGDSLVAERFRVATGVNQKRADVLIDITASTLIF